MLNDCTFKDDSRRGTNITKMLPTHVSSYDIRKPLCLPELPNEGSPVIISSPPLTANAAV